jgi:uncharacterized protein YhjY with autotransporter beta-barrel domain
MSMTKPSGKQSRARNWKLAASMWVLALSAGLGAAPSAKALVPNDEVGPAGSVDVDNEFAGVGMMWNRRLNANGTVSTFVCTGQLINPRTVVLAQHCTAGVNDEGYGPGMGNHMGFAFDPLNAFTGFDDWRRNPAGGINNPITGVWESLPDLDFYNVLQVNSVFNNAEFFPGGDLFMASFDTPVIGLPTYGMLFSPLAGPTHAAVVGYGTTGNGSLGPVGGIDFKRRAGENMIDGLFSQADFLAAMFIVPGLDFGVEGSQLLYHIDFDRPNRDPNDCERGEFFGTGNGNDLVCFTPPFGDIYTWDGSSGIRSSDHIDWYPGDALPNEASTAGGDSGSALFADEIYSRPLITGVLSGGWVTGLDSPNGGYGSVSYYNPLFLFRDWMVENNPYVYASAREGNGNWSDPRRWVQNMDPNYFYIDRFGRVRNGLPSEGEPGYFADAPKWGTVFDQAIPGDIEGATSPELALAAAPAIGATNFLGALDLAEDGGDSSDGGGENRPPSGPTASNGAPTGPGSRNFVPNNSYGAYGTWDSDADGVARFYDVTLNNEGRLRLDMNVEIDNLTINDREAELDVRSGFTINSLIAVDHNRGFVNVDGTLGTREYMLWGGILTGRGTINAETLFNVDGALSAGRLDSVGRLTLNGDYVQSSHGDMVINIRRQGGVTSSDFLLVNGAASLDGDAIVVPVNNNSKPRWRDAYTVMHANAVSGNFDDVHLVLAGPSLYGQSVVGANGDVVINVEARRLGQYYSNEHWLHSIGDALDQLRWSDNYSRLQSVFDLVDGTGFAGFDGTMFSLGPTNSFETVPMAVRYSQGFSQELDVRTAELRAGDRGLGMRSVQNGMRIAQAGAPSPDETDSLSFSRGAGPVDFGDRLGFFISGQGNVSAIGDEAYEGDRYNPARMTAFSSADMTVGADYRVNDHFALGVATTLSRYLSRGKDSGIIPMDHTGYGVMLYSSLWDGDWFVDSYLGVARHDYEMTRMAGLSFADGAESSPGAVQTLAGVRGGWMFEPLDALRIGPTISVNYSNLGLDAYNERGAGEFALNVDARDVRSVTAETGIDFSYRPQDGAGRSPFAAFGGVGFVTELGDGIDLVSARFTAAPDVAFDLARDLDREWISASAGISYQFGDHMSANLQASSDSGRGPLSNTAIRAGFNFEF